MRLIDADYLKQMFDVACGTNREVFNIADSVYNFAIKTIDDAPTVERPQGECKTCNYYHPYFEQFTNIPRGDGYCAIARMTPEGMTTINCNDDFGCSDYQEKQGGRE